MRSLPGTFLFSTILGICLCAQSVSAQTASSSFSSSSAPSSYSRSSTLSQFQPVDMRMRVSGVSAAQGKYIVKGIWYGDVERFDWDKGLYGANLLDSSAYTTNIESSGSTAVINLSLPSFLAGHNNITVVAGYANAPTLCNDNFQISSDFRNIVSTYQNGAVSSSSSSSSSVGTSEKESTAALCLQSTVSLTLLNTTERGFSKLKPRAPTDDPESEAEYYQSEQEYSQRINDYLIKIGLTPEQIESLCKDNGCVSREYPTFGCFKQKLNWVNDGPASSKTTKWKLSSECLCTDDFAPGF